MARPRMAMIGLAMVGGVDNVPIKGMSGGFAAKFELSVPNRVRLSFRANLAQSGVRGRRA